MSEKPKVKPKNAADTAQAALMWSIGFSHDDLEANRNGKLSHDQRRVFEQRRKWLMLGLLFMVVSTPLIFWLLKSPYFATIAQSCLFVLAVVYIPSSVIIFLYWQNYNRDLQVNPISAIQGAVRLDLSDTRGFWFSIRIRDMDWPIKKSVFLAFKNGDPYVIYYAPHTRTMLSAEWLREP